ncbi:heat shock factor binding protein 1-domain-containing protein [Kockovaella imperatae]|uniref:Heat shock factor binding protein 1-domain-containing protein n=1 Tax=Kockovaella imperatae TaxID=4999 RepID=A0A1Y1U8F5_9TREE|nr:heat shock factor binding protein 1-domain-containing protein [Kockovaella imperatae]ORX34303.1 heat shock factor binding protein 1-domain-containing protein [Kockovaella imperatae]
MSTAVSQPSQTTPSTAALQPSSSSIKRLSMISKGSTDGGASKSKVQAPALPTAISGGSVKDVVSPGELCGFVDTLLNSLEARFDEMSEQILGRMNEMSNRIDNMENTIQDLLQTGIESGPSPSPSPAPKR